MFVRQPNKWPFLIGFSIIFVLDIAIIFTLGLVSPPYRPCMDVGNDYSKIITIYLQTIFGKRIYNSYTKFLKLLVVISRFNYY